MRQLPHLPHCGYGPENYKGLKMSSFRSESAEKAVEINQDQ